MGCDNIAFILKYLLIYKLAFIGLELPEKIFAWKLLLVILI